MRLLLERHLTTILQALHALSAASIFRRNTAAVTVDTGNAVLHCPLHDARPVLQFDLVLRSILFSVGNSRHDGSWWLQSAGIRPNMVEDKFRRACCGLIHSEMSDPRQNFHPIRSGDEILCRESCFRSN